jgi:hypothetical protein
MWNCPKCNEEIEDQFDECWKCAEENLSSEEADLITYEKEAPPPNIFRDDGDLIICEFGDYYYGIRISMKLKLHNIRKSGLYPTLFPDRLSSPILRLAGRYA